jgi:hypothetical protein
VRRKGREGTARLLGYRGSECPVEPATGRALPFGCINRIGIGQDQEGDQTELFAPGNDPVVRFPIVDTGLGLDLGPSDVGANDPEAHCFGDVEIGRSTVEVDVDSQSTRHRIALQLLEDAVGTRIADCLGRARWRCSDQEGGRNRGDAGFQHGPLPYRGACRASLRDECW